MFRCGREQILAADDVGDAVVHVVDRRREVVGRSLVGAEDDEIVDLGVVEGHVAAHEVMERRGAGPRHPKSDRRLLPRLEASPHLVCVGLVTAVVGRRNALLAGRAAELVELPSRGERVVGLPLGDELLGHLLISGKALTLSIAAVGTADFDAFVPVQAEPPNAVEDVGGVLGRVFRSRSVSSLRKINVPPLARANSQLYNAVRAPPTWRYPVGDGANRTRTVTPPPPGSRALPPPRSRPRPDRRG